jgi:hypothetical protein
VASGKISPEALLYDEWSWPESSDDFSSEFSDSESESDGDRESDSDISETDEGDRTDSYSDCRTRFSSNGDDYSILLNQSNAIIIPDPTTAMSYRKQPSIGSGCSHDEGKVIDDYASRRSLGQNSLSRAVEDISSGAARVGPNESDETFRPVQKTMYCKQVSLSSCGSRVPWGDLGTVDGASCGAARMGPNESNATYCPVKKTLYHKQVSMRSCGSRGSLRSCGDGMKVRAQGG